jgi:diguanylate cyclase
MDSLGLDTSSKLRLQLLLGMCIIAGAIFLFLSILNLGLTSAYLLGRLPPIFAIFAIFAIFSAYFVYNLRKKKIQPWMQFCYLMSLSLLVLFAAHFTALSKAAYLWALIFPMLYYFLLGRKYAWLLCIGILIGQVSIIYLKEALYLAKSKGRNCVVTSPRTEAL